PRRTAAGAGAGRRSGTDPRSALAGGAPPRNSPARTVRRGRGSPGGPAAARRVADRAGRPASLPRAAADRRGRPVRRAGASASPSAEGGHHAAAVVGGGAPGGVQGAGLADP